MVDTLRNRLVQHWGHTIDEATRRVVMFDIQKTDELLYGNWDEESQRKFGKEIHATKKNVRANRSIRCPIFNNR